MKRRKDEKMKKDEKWEEGAVFMNDYRIKYRDSTEFLNFVHTKLLLWKQIIIICWQTAILCPAQISIRKELVVEVNSTNECDIFFFVLSALLQ